MSINVFGGWDLALGRRQRGMSLIELVMAIVIISVGLAGVLLAFSTVVASSANPMIQKQMLAIAEELMEEIALKPYSGTVVAPSGCIRSIYNNISNYNGYATSNYICDADGNQIASLANYSVSVAVVPDATTFASMNVTAASKITVTVSYGSQTFNLVRWRTNFAS